MQQDRQTSSRRASRAFSGILVAAWLGLGLQPCLVAVAEHACPHCPVEKAAESAAHHGAHEHGDAGEAAGGKAGPDCASMQAECCDAGSMLVVKRVGGDGTDTPDTPVGAPPPGPPAAPQTRITAAPMPPREPDARSAPLNVLNCVYLK